MRSRAVGAVLAQGTQAGISFILQILVARLLGVAELGRFAILYGIIIVATGVITGFVGDSLVVLERRTPTIRSALQSSSLVLGVAGAILAAVVVAAIGLVDPREAVAFGLALLAFTLEEVLRRLLMADFGFYRVVIADFSGFLVTVAIVVAWQLTSGATLAVFLGALAVGQTAALVIGAALVPRIDRFLVRPRRGGMPTLFRYGAWRGLQQLLRPGLLTAVRALVGLAAGLAAVGLLETARIYVAPALLVISGLTSYLFVSYARDRSVDFASRLRRADRTVFVLLGGTVLMGVVAVVLLPWAGPLLFNVEPELWAVVGWLAYTASVAAVTPFGSLAAVGGAQARVFAIRAGDTLFSAAAVAVVLALGGDVVLVPWALATGSLLGGLAIRWLILARPHAGGTPGAPGLDLSEP